jgi:hypothetical protein
MASIINASSTGSGGLISTGDASGVLQLQNNGSAALTVNTASQVLIGTTSAVTGTPALQISKTSAADYGQLFLNSTDSVAINKGGGISFGGSYTGTSPTYWAGIFGLKETATDGEYGGYLAFNTRPNGGGGTERMRISSAGVVNIASTLYFYPTGGAFGVTGPMIYNSSADAMGIGSSGTQAIIFGQNNSEKMRINSSGYLLVGTTSQPTNAVATAGSIVSAGSFTTYSGNLGNTTAGTSYNLFTITAGNSYIVNINGANTCSVYLVTCDVSGGAVTNTGLLVQNNANVTNSGTTIRFTNNYGGNLNSISWSATRLI